MRERVRGCFDAFSRDPCSKTYKPLYDACRTVLLRFARSRGASEPIAQEIVHDTLLYVWQNPEAFDGTRGDPTAWLHKIVRNRCIDHFRKDQRQFDRLNRASLSLAPTETDETPEQIQLNREAAALVRHAVETLPGPQEAIVQQTYFGDQSVRDAAAKLDVPVGTAKTRMRLALQKLKTKLRAET